jgi:hypothetical protein
LRFCFDVLTNNPFRCRNQSAAELSSVQIHDGSNMDIFEEASPVRPGVTADDPAAG